MFDLTLLGLQSVRAPDGREIRSLPAQPKRFALLAYLAIAGGDGYHRRDTLAAMFWPELDQFAARRALRNTLYHLRAALGDGVIVAPGDDAVSIDAGALTCDVTRLSDAVAACRFEEAIECYRGELLAGIHIANSGEAFEEWLSGERRNVRELVMRALRGLVERDESAGNLSSAAFWAQRACAIAPDDESWLRRAMSLLHAIGETAGALRLYETCARRLAAEFGAAPAAETSALATRIRSGREASARDGDLPHRTSDVDSPQPRARDAVASAAIQTVEPTGRGELAADVPAAHWRRASLLVTALGLAAALAVLGTRAANARHPPSPATRTRVLVGVFDNRTGDTHLQSLGRMTQDWLASGIMRTLLVDVVDPRAVLAVRGSDTNDATNLIALARRVGATMLISGAYYVAGDTLIVQAGLTDVRTGRIVRVVGPILSTVRTPVAELNELRSRVMTALASSVDARATQNLVGSDEIPLFDAYQLYVEGWDSYWHGNGARAESLFLHAARRDTGFVAASIAASTAAANYSDCPVVDSIGGALESRRENLDRVDRLSLRVAAARCHGRNDEMLRLALERADLESNTSSDKISVAAAALWANRPEQTVRLLERVDPTVDLAWSTDSTHMDYYGELAEALHRLGRYREELAIADRVPASAPLGRTWMRAWALAALSRPAEVLALLDSALTLPPEPAMYSGLAPGTEGRPQYTTTPAWVADWVSRELLVHGDTAASRQAAMRAIVWYRGRPSAERSTMEERLVAAWSLEMLGQFAEAERIVRQLLAGDSSNVDFRGELAGLAVERGDTPLADSLDRWLAAQPAARVGWSASVYRARVAALGGRSADAVRFTRDALNAGAWPLWIHIEPALAVLRTRPDFVAMTAPRN